MSHLVDDILVRRLDGELDPKEADRIEAHLRGCSRCRSSLAEIEELSTRFSAALTLVDSSAAARPAPRDWSRSPFWRAAAVIAVLAGLALAIVPVRAWVAERLGLAGDEGVREPGANGPVAPDPYDERFRITFVPGGDRFVIRLAGPQAAGTLIVTSVPGDTASAEILGPADHPAGILVLPDGIAIRNHPAASADYRVGVPLGLGQLEIRIGDRVAWTGTPADLDSRSPIDLTKPYP